MKYATYKMKENKYLGNCITVVVKLEEDEIPEGFTRPEVVVYVKPDSKVFEQIATVEDFCKVKLFGNEMPLLRIGSECMFGVFGDSHCNCEEERIQALTMIGMNEGIYVHMPQEAQGHGLFYKAQELNLQVNGILPTGENVGCKSQPEAAEILLGTRMIDIRNYEFIARLFKELGLDGYVYRFMSRNREKMKCFTKAGIQIGGMVDVTTRINNENIAETLVKWIEKGYCFTMDEAIQIINLLESGERFPERAEKLIYQAYYMYQNMEEREKLIKHSHLDMNTEKILEKAIYNYVNCVAKAA